MNVIEPIRFQARMQPDAPALNAEPQPQAFDYTELSADDAKLLRTRAEQIRSVARANATSYGIFVELNLEDYKTSKTMIGNGADGQPFKFGSESFEKPGNIFTRYLVL